MATEVLTGAVKSFQDDGKGKKDEGTLLEPKDFFWDQFLKYISSAILALTVLNVSVEFLRRGGVQCFPPTISKDQNESDFTLRQSDYLNSFCSESVPSSEFFPLYILVQGLLLVAPHFIWGAVFKGDFDSFFAVTEKLDRLRDRNTGMYDSTNFDRVEKLELEFGSKRKRIFLSYILKLLLQLAICVATVIFSETYFNDFSFTFKCPVGSNESVVFPNESVVFPENWPLNTTIPCVFTSLRVLSLIRYGDYILTGMAVVLIGVGLIWCVIRHTKELGHIDIAQFVFQSCLTTRTHVFPPFYEVRSKLNPTENCWFCFFPFALCFPCCKGCILCSFRFMLFTPRIQNDLDFLQMTLFRADSSHGRVFKEIQIDKELQKLHGKDHQLIHLFLNVQLDMDALINKKKDKAVQGNDGSNLDSEVTHRPVQVLPREVDLHHFFKMSGFSGNPEKYAYTHYQSLLGNTEWKPVEGIRDRLYGFVKFCPKQVEGNEKGEVKTDMAMDISFGSSGYALVLARAFRTVVSVNFRPFFRNENKPIKKETFYTNYINVDFPENIFTHGSDNINEAVRQMVDPMFEDKKRPVDFIVVGPFEEDTKRITVTLAIEMLYTTEIIEEEAILLAVRPLQIGHRKTTKRFLKYEPPVQLFDHSFHEETVLPQLRAEVEPDFREVDGAIGITVKCGDTNCIFEFITYKYIGEVERKPNATSVEHMPGSNAEPLTTDHHLQDENPLQPIPVNSQHLDFQQQSLSHNDSDHDYSSLSASLHPLHSMEEPLQQRRSKAHLPKLEQRTFDLSPRTRLLKRQKTLEEATLRSNSNIPNNDLQAHSSDSNRRQYTAEQGKRSNQPAVDVHISASSSCALSQGPNNTTVSTRPGTGGSNSHYQSQRSQTISSTVATMPLSSIDEDGSYESTESSVVSPEPVFTTPTDQ